MQGSRSTVWSLLAAATFTVIGFLPTADAASAGFDAFVIRDSNGDAAGGNPPVIGTNSAYAGHPTATSFVISEGSQKAALGTNLINGFKVGEITRLAIQRLDDHTRFATNQGAYYAPYMNIWITDGSGRFAVIANEPSNAEWLGTSEWDTDWNTLMTKTLKVFETNDKSWLPNNGVGLTFSDVASFTIQAPDAIYVAAGNSNGVGGGAPRELGTNATYGFNWVFGDTLANYVSGSEGYVVDNAIAQAAAVPLPASIWGGLALMGMLGGRALLKRTRKQAA